MTSFNMDDFGAYTNVNNIVQKEATGGDSAKNQVGDSYTEQTGNSISRQIGNKNAYQHGYSNSLIVGMSFSTSLAATFSTTVGASVSTTVGLAIGTNLLGKVALFGGIEASINASQAIKLVKGDNYTWDTASKNEFGDQKIESDRKKLVIANDLKQVITDEIAVYAGNVSRVAGGSVTETIGSRDITCATSYTLTSPTVTLNGPTSLTATTAGDLTLNSGTLKMLGGTASMSFFGVIKIG